jgi:methyltransferase-like protein 6
METVGGGEPESTGKDEAETEYHSHDFDWEDLKAEVEGDPAFSYHLSPLPGAAATTNSPPPPPSSEAWASFHRRHASGKFFKVASPFPTVNAFYRIFLAVFICLFNQE